MFDCTNRMFFTRHTAKSITVTNDDGKFKLIQLRRKRSYNNPLGEFVAFEADFASGGKWESEDTFVSKIVKIQTHIKSLKRLFRH